MSAASRSTYSVLTNTRSGYISASFSSNSEGHKHGPKDFYDGSTAAIVPLSKLGTTPPVDTPSAKKRIRTLILPMPVLLEATSGTKTPAYIGTSSNVSSKASVIFCEAVIRPR